MSENVNEFPFPEVSKQSHEASAMMLQGIAATFQALGHAERGNTDAAEGAKREALSLFERSAAMFAQIEKEMKARKIDITKAPKALAGVPFERILAVRGYKVPDNTVDLAKIATTQLATYRKTVEGIDFKDKATSRDRIAIMIRELHLLMDLGIVISHLADAAS